MAARQNNRLKPTQLCKLGPGRHGDGNYGLMLFVRKDGSRQWIQRVTLANGKRADLGLGAPPAVCLGDARKRAIANKAEIWAGRDPRQPTVPRFREIVAEYRTDKLADWSRSTRVNFDGAMAKHVLPKLGTIRVDSLTPNDILGVVKPIWNKAAGPAARSNIRAVLDVAVTRGFLPSNPAADLNGALPRMRTNAHHNALPYAEMPGLYAALAGAEQTSAVLVLRLLMLTAVRSQEAAQATASEFDLDTGVWAIPAGRMKTGKAHSVPLAPEAVAVVREAMKLNPDAEYVFRGVRKDAPMASSVLAKPLAGATTVHGFRAAFRTWAAENGVDHAVAEHALAHTVGSQVEQAYQRSTLFDQRRELMSDWSAYLTARQG